MAEIGLIASVIQVTLSKALYQYADSVSSADKRIRDIAQDVKLTSFVIDELGRIFKQDETAALISKNAVNTAEETVRECSNVFTEMEAALKKSKKNTLGRLMLPFREPKLELLRTNIDRLKSTLQLLMQVLTHAHQISALNPDKKKVAAQRQQIKALIQTKKESTKRYEKSLRNYNMSDGSTAMNDDDNLGANINDEKHETTDRSINMFNTASSIGSTITAKGLESCVEHIQKLLKDIEAVQRVLNANVDGTSPTDYEQGLIGAYFRTRSALDSVILGSSSTAKVDLGLEEVMSPKNEQLSLTNMEGEQEEKIRLEVALRKTAVAAEGPDMDVFVDFDPLVSHSPSSQNRFTPRHPFSGFKQQTGLPPFKTYELSPSEILERAEEEDDRARRAAQDARDLLESKRCAEEESVKLKCPTEETLRVITFKDAIGRKFSFPFHMCKTWKGIEELINQAFLHVDVIGPHVREGRYDLVGPDDGVILPQLWETAVQPDWVVTMHMWPTPEPPQEQHPSPPPPPPMPNPHTIIVPSAPGGGRKTKKGKTKKSKKITAHHGQPPPPPPPPPPPMDVIEVPPPPPRARHGMIVVEYHASRKKELPISPFLHWTAGGSMALPPPKSAAKPESPSSSDPRIRSQRVRRMQERDSLTPKPPPQGRPPRPNQESPRGRNGPQREVPPYPSHGHLNNHQNPPPQGPIQGHNQGGRIQANDHVNGPNGPNQPPAQGRPPGLNQEPPRNDPQREAPPDPPRVAQPAQTQIPIRQNPPPPPPPPPTQRQNSAGPPQQLPMPPQGQRGQPQPPPPPPIGPLPGAVVLGAPLSHAPVSLQPSMRFLPPRFSNISPPPIPITTHLPERQKPRQPQIQILNYEDDESIEESDDEPYSDQIETMDEQPMSSKATWQNPPPLPPPPSLPPPTQHLNSAGRDERAAGREEVLFEMGGHGRGGYEGGEEEGEAGGSGWRGRLSGYGISNSLQPSTQPPSSPSSSSSAPPLFSLSAPQPQALPQSQYRSSRRVCGIEGTRKDSESEREMARLVTEEKLLARAMEERVSKGSRKEMARARARARAAEERARARAAEERARARAAEMARVRTGGAEEDSEEEMELSKERERFSARAKKREMYAIREARQGVEDHPNLVAERERERERERAREKERARAKAMEWEIVKPGAIAEGKRARAKSEEEWTRKGSERELAIARAEEERARARAEERQMARTRTEEEMAKARAEKMARKAGGEWMRRDSETESNSDKDDVDELLHEWTTLYAV